MIPEELPCSLCGNMKVTSHMYLIDGEFFCELCIAEIEEEKANWSQRK